MRFKNFYLTEAEKATWLGSCINFRRKSPENEKIWQNIMATKKKISEKEFLKSVTIEDLLDRNETWEDWKETNSDDYIKLYKSGDYYFIQNKGFEYLWKKNSINEDVITEMPKIVAGSQDDWSRSEQHWLNNVDLYKNSTLVKEYKKDFTYRITKDSRGNLDIFCINPNESGSPIVVGLLQFRKEFPIKKYKYPKISWVAVHPAFRNKNIGTGLYSTAIAHFGGLVSDSSLTKSKEGGSQNIWKLLAKVYNVYAYDGKLFKELDYNDIDSDEYNSYDILFVVSDKPIKGAIRDD